MSSTATEHPTCTGMASCRCADCAAVDAGVQAWHDAMAHVDTPTELAFTGLWDRNGEAREAADVLDHEADGMHGLHAVQAIDAFWGNVAGYWGGLDEDAAELLPLAVYAAYVVAVERAVADAATEAANEDIAGPATSWGASGWDAEAFPKAALGL